MVLFFLFNSILLSSKREIIVENAKQYIKLWSNGDIYQAVEEFWDLSYFVSELLGGDIQKTKTHEKIYITQLTKLFLKVSLSAKPILSLIKDCKFVNFKNQGIENNLSIVSFDLIFPKSNEAKTKKIYFHKCDGKWKIVDVMNEGKRMSSMLKKNCQLVKKKGPNFKKITLFEIYLLNALKLKLEGFPEKAIN